MKKHSVAKNLGPLSDPKKNSGLMDLANQDVQTLKQHLKSMLQIRKAEQQLAFGRKEGLIGGPVHLGVGQEAIAVGVSTVLTKTDRVFGAHRSHSHILALSSDPYRLFAEALGKDTGFSKGMGGSMHLFDQQNGFYGSVPIVAGTVSLAVGAAMAAKMQNTDDIAVAYFGDGAMEEGIVHEALNLACMQKAPVLFVVENNLFASHMHISVRQPYDSMCRFADANHIPSRLVDGNNVVAVADATSEFVEDMRNGGGARFLEAVTYRWYGHVDWREDIDVGVNRSKEELENWRERDPVLCLSRAMIAENMWSQHQEDTLNNELDEQIAMAWGKAMKDPYPSSCSTLDRVYAKTP